MIKTRNKLINQRIVIAQGKWYTICWHLSIFGNTKTCTITCYSTISWTRKLVKEQGMEMIMEKKRLTFILVTVLTKLNVLSWCDFSCSCSWSCNQDCHWLTYATKCMCEHLKTCRNYSLQIVRKYRWLTESRHTSGILAPKFADGSQWRIYIISTPNRRIVSIGQIGQSY